MSEQPTPYVEPYNATNCKALRTFVVNTQEELSTFEKLYRAKHLENPEHYPLDMAKDNYGLWMELFLMYLENGSV